VAKERRINTIRGVSFDQTPRNILYFLESVDVDDKLRRRLENAFAQATETSTSDKNRWERYIKSDKATSHVRKST
jgi:hypothetical protein